VGSNEFGLTRLFEYLANIKNYPTPLRAASCVSGIAEESIKNLLSQGNPYVVIGDKIHVQEVKKVDKVVHKVSVFVLQQIHDNCGINYICEDGKITAVAMEDGHELQ
jgi:hypothetical protein